MRYLRGFGQFWYDFVIGDDWKLAAVVAILVAIGAILVASGVAGAALPVLLALGLAAGFTAALLIDVRPVHRDDH